MFRKSLAFAMMLIALPAWGMVPTIELPTDARGEMAIAALSSGSVVALIGASRRWSGHGSTLSLVSEALTDDDRDGSVRFSPHGGVSKQSLWIAVDVAMGLEGDDVLLIFDPHRLAYAITTAGAPEWVRAGEVR